MNPDDQAALGPANSSSAEASGLDLPQSGDGQTSAGPVDPDSGADASLAESVIAPTVPKANLDPLTPGALERMPMSDPWAHRRGEPRVFAFAWTVFVMLCVSGSALWLSRTGSLVVGVYGPAARIMLMVVAIGATVLWPMTRLSQASPKRGLGRGPVRSVFTDALIVLMPILLILPPTALLSGWPVLTLISVSSVFIVWVALTGGMLALALSGPTTVSPMDPGVARRSAWMLGFVGLGLSGPLLMAVSAFWRVTPPDWALMLSPLTALLSLTGTGYQGPGSALGPSQSAALLCLWVVATLTWWLAAGRSARESPLPVDPSGGRA